MRKAMVDLMKTKTAYERLNLKFYSGQDCYSDGTVEDDLLNIVECNRDVIDILSEDTRWPILYHLSPQRRNLLEWYPFQSEAALLEIGAGCGALTGLFCEKVSHVTAIELSKRRAMILLKRHRRHQNLEVIVGNLQDIKLQRQFNYVTLIGVMEYTKSFVHTPHPYRDFLQKVIGCMKPSGKVFIAIENKLGLKYFSGHPEEHTGKMFEGIQGYPSNSTIETFGKQEICELLLDNGLINLEFYYPYPDYKLPDEVYSDGYLPDVSSFLKNIPNFDREKFVFFNERLAWLNIIKNKCFDIFANSFLIIGKKSSS